MKTTILWFRRDLRLHDNSALNWACDNSTSILPVYIYSAAEEHPWIPGGASRWWLHQSLAELDKKLQSHGLKLHFFSGSSHDILAKLIQQTGAETLVFNRLYEPHLHQRDLDLQQRLRKTIQVIPFESGLFFNPGTILNKQQLPYRVFTPFYKKFRPLIEQAYNHYSFRPVKPLLAKLSSPAIQCSLTLTALELLDHSHWHKKLYHHWQPGEENALALLEQFLNAPISAYATNRDIPSIEGTSRLSPYLHFGEITPQQIYLSLRPLLENSSDSRTIQAAEVFLKQLIWREFAHTVLWNFPDTATRPMNRRYKDTFWQTSSPQFMAWSKGQTGIPIIDAGMKQLWETGWMHNRVRMIVSSFLTKNLGCNWSDGAKWFWDTLVDANLANNSLGWQWVAGCGVDAAPYYRIFNPLTQAKRFDPGQKYINSWLPEHTQPDYPAPVVDLEKSRKDALQRYRQYISP